MMEQEKNLILEIENLRVTYETDLETVEAVNGISFRSRRAKRWVWWGRPARERPPRR